MPNLTMALGLPTANLNMREPQVRGPGGNAKAVLIRGKLFSSSMFEIVNVKVGLCESAVRRFEDPLPGVQSPD
jgi:hypothetical protein